MTSVESKVSVGSLSIKSHPLVFKDFDTVWYKKWASELKQNKDHLDGYALKANKFWQNAAICEALSERDLLKEGVHGLGFGVGNERLPALFAKLGVDIMATDQDFRTTEAKHWSKKELFTDVNELNQLGICDNKVFVEKVKYLAVDMRKVPSSLFGKYDFLWSNCALGHLGSIDAGLEFIEKSLKCLKPGGWAVHTTEVNIQSNSETVTGGDTVVFRLGDIYKLSKRLLEQGYICQPLNFDLGNSTDDMRISMHPTFGNDYSKIRIGDFLATQVILLIHKPSKDIKKTSKYLARTSLYKDYIKSISSIRKFVGTNAEVKKLLASRDDVPDTLNIKPIKKEINVVIPRGKSKDIFLSYKNNSEVNLYGMGHCPVDKNPIVLGTDLPKDRESAFAGSSWFDIGKNRPSIELNIKKAKGFVPAKSIKPGQEFAIRVVLNANKLKGGDYVENFGIVHERTSWIEGAAVKVNVKVV